MQDLCNGLLKAIEVSSEIVKNFLNLPHKDTFPDYYEVIKKPI